MIAGERFSLSPPRSDPNLTPSDRRTAQENLAGNRGWRLFSRSSTVTTFSIDLDYLKFEAD